MKEFLDVEYKEGLQIDMYLPDNCEDGYDVFVYFHNATFLMHCRKSYPQTWKSFLSRLRVTNSMGSLA